MTRRNALLLSSSLSYSTTSKMYRRAPIVSIMGHVDHGKTTLLDRLRNANVAAGEPGGITQHIGAFTAHLTGTQSEAICFLDTPGHAAFKAVREHGALATDLVVLVLAMDDGVMPTTVEAVELTQRLRLPMVVALSKVDLFSAGRVLQERRLAIARQLSEIGVLLEGEPTHGDTQSVMVSAVTGSGLSDLILAIQAQAAIIDDAAMLVDPDKRGSGYIIESKRAVGLGDVASVVLKNGAMRVGEWVVAGHSYGRVRQILDECGRHVGVLAPSTPASVVTGWREGSPVAGEEVVVVGSEAEAKEVVGMMRRTSSGSSSSSSSSGDDASATTSTSSTTTPEAKPALQVIVKADVQGSLEALRQALSTIPQRRATVEFVAGSQGELCQHDIDMALTCPAPLILLFNVPPPSRQLEKQLRHHRLSPPVRSTIIYTLLDAVKERLRALLPKQDVVQVTGQAVVRQLFQVSHHRTNVVAAGCMVTDRALQTGRVSKDGHRHAFRIVRGEGRECVYEGQVASMRHGKEEVGRVAAGMECGLVFEGGPAVLVGDVVQAITVVQEEPSLD
jgi:translation initiation factor IF-2